MRWQWFFGKTPVESKKGVSPQTETATEKSLSPSDSAKIAMMQNQISNLRQEIYQIKQRMRKSMPTINELSHVYKRTEQNTSLYHNYSAPDTYIQARHNNYQKTGTLSGIPIRRPLPSSNEQEPRAENITSFPTLDQVLNYHITTEQTVGSSRKRSDYNKTSEHFEDNAKDNANANDNANE